MVNQLSWNILKQFSQQKRYNFLLKDVVEEFPGKSSVTLSRTLSAMVRNGMLCKIAPNNYHLIPIQEDPESYVPDGLQIAKYIMRDKEYYIGYASALRIHGFREDSKASASEEFVVTPEKPNSTLRSVLGIKCHIIQQHEARFFGYENTWINQKEQALVSDLEKTIVDIATKPQHCGGITLLGQALVQFKKMDKNALYQYFERNGIKSAKKRYLFITHLLGLEWTRDHDHMMKGLGSGISLLDPSAPDQGRKLSRFGLKINVDPTKLKNIR